MKLDHWNPGKKKPGNLYKYFKSTGLVTVFPARNGYSFVANGEFHGSFPTQKDAQIEAEKFAVAVRKIATTALEIAAPILADSQDEKRSNNVTEATAATQATEAPQATQQYMTKAHWDKLMGYINQLAQQYNALSEEHNKTLERIAQLENWELTRQRLENERVEARTRKLRQQRQQTERELQRREASPFIAEEL
jgi:hypothetical protein